MTCLHENKITDENEFVVCTDCGLVLRDYVLQEDALMIEDKDVLIEGLYDLNIVGTQPSLKLARDGNERLLARRLERTQVRAFTSTRGVKHLIKARHMISGMMARLEHDKPSIMMVMRAYEARFKKGEFTRKKMSLSVGSFVLHELKKRGHVGDVEGFARDAGLDVDLKSFKKYCWKEYQIVDTSIDMFTRFCRDLQVSSIFLKKGLKVLEGWRSLHAKATTKAIAVIQVVNDEIGEIKDFSMKELELADVIGMSTVRHFLQRVKK